MEVEEILNIGAYHKTARTLTLRRLVSIVL